MPMVTSRAGRLKIAHILRSTFRAELDMVHVQRVGMICRQEFVNLSIAAWLLAEASAALEYFVAPH
jgi:hypothetical protein